MAKSTTKSTPKPSPPDDNATGATGQASVATPPSEAPQADPKPPVPPEGDAAGATGQASAVPPSSEAPQADPKPELQPFKTIYNVIFDGETVPPGKVVDLTREQFDELSATGAIAGEWIEE